MTLDCEALRDPTPVRPPSSPRFVSRRILRVGLVVLLIAVAYYMVSFWQVRSTGRSDEARAVDAIVVMGAAQYDGRPSPQLAARLDHAVSLWDEELAPVVDGHRRQPRGRPVHRGDGVGAVSRRTRCPAVGDRAGGCRFDHPRVARSDDGAGRGIRRDRPGGHRSVPRAALKLTAEEVGFTAYVSPAPDSVVVGAAELRRELAEAAGVAVGRIIGFERLSGLTD